MELNAETRHTTLNIDIGEEQPQEIEKQRELYFRIKERERYRDIDLDLLSDEEILGFLLYQ